EGLAEPGEMGGGEPVAHVLRGGDDVGPAQAFAGIEIEDDPVADVEAVDPRAAHVPLEHARLHQRAQPFDALDREDLSLVAVGYPAQDVLAQTSTAWLREEARAVGGVRAAQRP